MKIIKCACLFLMICVVCIEMIYMKKMQEASVYEASIIAGSDETTVDADRKANVEAVDTAAVSESNELEESLAALMDQKVIRVLLLSEDGDEYWNDIEVVETEDGTLQSEAFGEYQGKIEIIQTKQGYVVINELPVEQYLYAVLPSEMPESFGLEAYKAQAVCARSYAYQAMNSYAYEPYRAHVDDSVAFQVYQKEAATSLSKQAVDETAGQVMIYAGEVIDAYYFSTSWGVTSDLSAWNEPIEEAPYLVSCMIGGENKQIDYSTEETFQAALTQTEPASIEKDCKYFRWKGSLSLNQSTVQTIDMIERRRAVAPDDISYTIAADLQKLDTIQKFGKIVNIVNKQRNRSGAVVACSIVFEHTEVSICGEYNIRLILGTMLQELICADHSTYQNGRILPSAYFYLETVDENEQVVICGGGYGHGVGMSQYAASILAGNGMKYEEILSYFYKDIEIASDR